MKDSPVLPRQVYGELCRKLHGRYWLQVEQRDASSFQLAELLPISPFTDPVAIETIRNTLSLYAFAIDGRNWQAFSRVFAPDARANYSEPLPVLYGLQNITDAIAAQVTQFTGTHHRYGTQYIAICSPTSAISVTYLEASHFFLPHTSPVIEDDSNTLFATGRYEDTWKKTNGIWKIVNRNLVFIGPFILDTA
ncbi:uncharacterized protein EAE98_000601 [Botrytis deweyae]|uniref:SnoaL-like domain-containing protein n=1 Tax=Botrytis deweyae TaxID=2478750 RepID=A0ABQ7J367_9HELO|nr:uncharacterized protein EAE98_000601 [Botrytis deweyae]KAF7940474.1 hypothetical protein EAE98_000601 [Botrytis deweyae]